MKITNEAFDKAMELLEVEKDNKKGYFIRGIYISCCEEKIIFDYSSLTKEEKSKGSFFYEVFLPSLREDFSKCHNLEGLVCMILYLKGNGKFDYIEAYQISSKVYDYLIALGEFSNKNLTSKYRKEEDLDKWEDFFDLLEIFDGLVNPYGTEFFSVKEKAEDYLTKVRIQIQNLSHFNRICLFAFENKVFSSFTYDTLSADYDCLYVLQEDRKNFVVNIKHKYYDVSVEDFSSYDEYVEITIYEPNKSVKDYKFRLSDRSVYNVHKFIPPHDITEEELLTLIHYLKLANKKMFKKITRHMINVN